MRAQGTEFLLVDVGLLTLQGSLVPTSTHASDGFTPPEQLVAIAAKERTFVASETYNVWGLAVLLAAVFGVAPLAAGPLVRHGRAREITAWCKHVQERTAAQLRARMATEPLSALPNGAKLANLIERALCVSPAERPSMADLCGGVFSALGGAPRPAALACFELRDLIDAWQTTLLVRWAGGRMGLTRTGMRRPMRRTCAPRSPPRQPARRPLAPPVFWAVRARSSAR